MNIDDDMVALAVIVTALQDPAFREWRIWKYGIDVELPGGCVGEIQPDGALVCIACANRDVDENGIEWLPS